MSLWKYSVSSALPIGISLKERSFLVDKAEEYIISIHISLLYSHSELLLY